MSGNCWCFVWVNCVYLLWFGVDKLDFWGKFVWILIWEFGRGVLLFIRGDVVIFGMCCFYQWDIDVLDGCGFLGCFEDRVLGCF